MEEKPETFKKPVFVRPSSIKKSNETSLSLTTSNTTNASNTPSKSLSDSIKSRQRGFISSAVRASTPTLLGAVLDRPERDAFRDTEDDKHSEQPNTLIQTSSVIVSIISDQQEDDILSGRFPLSASHPSRAKEIGDQLAVHYAELDFSEDEQDRAWEEAQFRKGMSRLSSRMPVSIRPATVEGEDIFANVKDVSFFIAQYQSDLKKAQAALKENISALDAHEAIDDYIEWISLESELMNLTEWLESTPNELPPISLEKALLVLSQAGICENDRVALSIVEGYARTHIKDDIKDLLAFLAPLSPSSLSSVMESLLPVILDSNENVKEILDALRPIIGDGKIDSYQRAIANTQSSISDGGV